MAQAILNHVLEQIKMLEPDELHQVDQAIKQQLEPTVSQTSALASTARSESLYDLLEGVIGSVEGNGENYSEQTGVKFTEYLSAKHAEGHL